MLDKIKDMLDDLKYNIPDWVMFVVKVSAIAIVWVLLLG